MQKLAGWEGDRVHIHGLVTYGPLFSGNYLGNILAVSNIEAGAMARLYAFWYEHNAPDNLWSIHGSPQRGSLHATSLWHFDAAEWAPSTAS